jgi:hypothetical protein
VLPAAPWSAQEWPAWRHHGRAGAGRGNWLSGRPRRPGRRAWRVYPLRMRAMSRLLRGAIALLVLSACAGLSSEKTVQRSDLEDLRGEWKGTWSEGSWSGPMTLTIYPGDGVGEFRFDTPSGAGRSITAIEFEGGKLVLKGAAGQTTLTLHERDRRRGLIGEYRYETGQAGSVELWRE